MVTVNWSDSSWTTGMWRYRGHLPVLDPGSITSLGEGATPFVDLPALASQCGISGLAGKSEYLNPTGSFKDRIASVAMSLVVDRGLVGCVGTSSGNGGAAIAAYAAHAGRQAVLFAMAETPAEKLQQIQAFGATVFRVAGLGSDKLVTDHIVNGLPGFARDRGFMPFITAFRVLPDAMEGAKTIALEIAESSPNATAVYVPVGGGGLHTAIGRGYSHARALPEDATPRLVGVQPQGCATLSLALRGEPPHVPGGVDTEISGLQVATLLDADGARHAVTSTGGHAVTVSDADVFEAQRLLAAEGVLVEPAGATALAGVLSDSRSRRLGPNDDVVIILTGAGWKDATSLRRAAENQEIPLIDADQIPEQLAGL